MIQLVVTDMDNTLYPWVDYIVPSVEAMVAAVVHSTGLPTLRVIQSLKAVYEKYESNEYPYALQESSLFTEYPEFGSFDKLVIEPARAAFAEARRKYLKPFRGVVETLQLLKKRGIRVVALTDAPRNPAEYRARAMGLDGLLSALYTLPSFRFPRKRGQTLVANTIVRKEEKGGYRAACPVMEMPRSFEKPSARGLLRICRNLKVRPADTLFVGDSLHKDVLLAQRVGAVDCWAEYGTYVSLEYRERLDIISAPSITRRHAASMVEPTDSPVVRPTHSLSNFAQILDVISGHEAKLNARSSR